MDRTERVEAAVAGRPVDRVPVSAWGHFFTRETTAASLAETMLAFRETYDWDYLKIHARASYHVEGWGFTYEPSRDPAKGHVCTASPIHNANDWRKLKPLPLTTPAFAEQFQLIELIRKDMPKRTPLIMTVFLPLDMAEKLVDRNPQLLKQHIEEDPDSVRHAVEVFTETFVPFVRKVAASGVDGIYFSTKWANHRKLAPETYRRLTRDADLQVIAEAKGLWCNFLHLCEDEIQLRELADYPVQVFHWDTRTPGNPNFATARESLSGALGGGVDAATLAEGTPAEVEAVARDAIRQTEGRGFLLGPGCSVRIAATPADNLHALRKAAETAAV